LLATHWCAAAASGLNGGAALVAHCGAFGVRVATRDFGAQMRLGRLVLGAVSLRAQVAFPRQEI
jgi:hypothetical protein